MVLKSLFFISFPAAILTNLTGGETMPEEEAK